MSEDIVITIGISGVTCGGKTTVAAKLHKVLPNSTIISQDDYFLDDQDSRHVWIPELNHVNYDILSSIDMHKMYEDISKIVGEVDHMKGPKESLRKLPKNDSEMNNQQEIFRKLRNSHVSFLIVEGFSIFNYKPLVHLLDLKYYFLLDKTECSKRRSTRVYNPPDCPGYFEKCVWPEHIKHLAEVKSFVNDITYFDGKCGENFVEMILSDIINNL